MIALPVWNVSVVDIPPLLALSLTQFFVGLLRELLDAALPVEKLLRGSRGSVLVLRGHIKQSRGHSVVSTIIFRHGGPGTKPNFLTAKHLLPAMLYLIINISGVYTKYTYSR